MNTEDLKTQFELAVKLQQQKQLPQAIALYEKLRPALQNHLGLNMNLGQAYFDNANFEKALKAFEKSCHINPNLELAKQKTAYTQIKLGQFEKALQVFQNSNLKDPENQIGLSLTLKHLGRWLDSLKVLDDVLKAHPQHFEALANKATLYRMIGEPEKALAFCDQALSQQPQNAELHFNRGLNLLLLEQWQPGWDEIEWRLKTPNYQNLVLPGIKKWNGEPLANKHLLFICEQGLAEEILHASLIPDLQNQNAQITILCDTRLCVIFERSFKGIKAIARDQNAHQKISESASDFDFQTPAMSAFRFLRKSETDFPKRLSYLVANEEKTKAVKTRYFDPKAKMHIGISWKSSSTTRFDANASIRKQVSTTLNDWLPVLKTPGIRWINLQYGDCQNEIDTFKKEHGITIFNDKEIDPLKDLEASFAQMAGLDLSLGIQSAPSMMTGALGIPTWVAVNKQCAAVFGNKAENPLLMPSMRLFRQKEFGEWASVFNQISKSLKAF
ncbi:MAG: tetratricopeptide repeat protein [Deltaproteobacteria bacterium]|nr:tetratricopeptide repeat protein [Deltaproteobacteria bacterium]